MSAQQMWDDAFNVATAMIATRDGLRSGDLKEIIVSEADLQKIKAAEYAFKVCQKLCMSFDEAGRCPAEGQAERLLGLIRKLAAQTLEYAGLQVPPVGTPKDGG